jgi:hypothetical protein
MAAKDYDRLAANNGVRDGYHDGTFLASYPTKELYVNEWWEERYLPLVDSEATCS